MKVGIGHSLTAQPWAIRATSDEPFPQPFYSVGKFCRDNQWKVVLQFSTHKWWHHSLYIDCFQCTKKRLVIIAVEHIYMIWRSAAFSVEPRGSPSVGLRHLTTHRALHVLSSMRQKGQIFGESVGGPRVTVVWWVISTSPSLSLSFLFSFCSANTFISGSWHCATENKYCLPQLVPRALWPNRTAVRGWSIIFGGKTPTALRRWLIIWLSAAS